MATIINLINVIKGEEFVDVAISVPVLQADIVPLTKGEGRCLRALDIMQSLLFRERAELGLLSLNSSKPR